MDTSIKDYFMIGGLRSSALVSKTGSIDWLCLPYFDSPSIFGKLLGPSGGSFSLDTTNFTSTSQYIADTAIVETTLKSSTAEVSLHDFMVPLDTTNLRSHQYLVRKLVCRKATTSIVFNFNPKPNYAHDVVSWQQQPNQLIAPCSEGWLVLRLPQNAMLRRTKTGFDIQLDLLVGEPQEIILEYQPDRLEQASSPRRLEETTTEFWHNWVSKGNFVSFCRDNLVRSVITLKLMQFAPTGAIVAAPTTSLPETLGGIRNWDYRYTWIRDATFTLYAFYVLGYQAEAERFLDFIHGIIERCDEQQFDISLMYTIFGQPVPNETTLDNLAGYKSSKPVRIGNGAAKQFQLDVYGSLIDAVYFATKRGITSKRKIRARRLVMNLVKKIEQTWRLPDSGIWEVRSDRQQFTYSRVMCWVGAERAIRLQGLLGLSDKEVGVCHNLANNIKNWLWQNAYSAEIKNFSQYPDTEAVDATNLLFVLLQFLDKHDPKTRQIIDNTRSKLGFNEVLVYRYQGKDGLSGKEGAFMLCSFWLISALAIVGDTDEALKLFQKIENSLAPSGLIAEEIDTETGEYLGNYPQAFSQIGYIMSAYYLDRYMKRKAGLA